MTSQLPRWVESQLAARAIDQDMAARRRAYDDWARAYADSGVRVDGQDQED